MDMIGQDACETRASVWCVRAAAVKPRRIASRGQLQQHLSLAAAEVRILGLGLFRFRKSGEEGAKKPRASSPRGKYLLRAVPAS